MIKRIKFLTIAFMTFWLLVTICHFLFKPIIANDVLEISDGWTLEHDGNIYENINLIEMPNQLNFKPKKGDIFSLTVTLPRSDVYTFPTFIFLSRYSAFDAKVNGEHYVSKYKDSFDRNEFIGSGYNIISLPYSSEPVSITITYYVEETVSYNYFIAPVYGDYHDVVRTHLFINLFPLSSGIFLIIFGAAFFVITMGFYKTMPNILSHLFSSVMFINLGIWLLCYFNLIDFFVYTKSKSTEVEYVCLNLMIPLTYLIIGCIQQHYKNWFFLVVACSSSFICLLLIVLHFTGIIHMNRTLIYFQCISVMCSIFMLTIFIRDIKLKKLDPSEIIQITGLSIFALSYLISFIVYSLEIRHIVPSSFLSIRIMPMAGLAFVFATLINYFIYLSESYAMRKEYASLTHLAYADGLTDLPNRSRYDKYMSDLDKGDEEYCIISLDLNGLKEINDNDGHAAGDKYLLEFASVLKQCFQDKAFIARIGGDEFVAIMKSEHFDLVDSLITRLKDALEVKNVLYPGYRRSVASGYAFSTEVKEKSSHSVYLLADKRMYENKKLMHAKLGIIPRI